MTTLTDAPPRALPLFGEGWVGSGCCSECSANHPGQCNCECHSRWFNLIPLTTAPQSGLSPDCGTGCHAPLCDGRNCSCDCHAPSSATRTEDPGPVLTPPPNPAKPPAAAVTVITTKQDMARWARTHAGLPGIPWTVTAGPGGTMIITEHPHDRRSHQTAGA